MAYLDGYFFIGHIIFRHIIFFGEEWHGEPVHVVNRESLLVGGLGIVAVGDEEDILLYVLLDGKPWTSTEAQSVTLPYGVKPQSLVHADLLARFDVNDESRLLAEVLAEVVVVVYLAKKADALRVLALGVDEMFTLCYTAHLTLLVVPDREDGFLQLPVVDLRKEIRLVLYWIWGCNEPLTALFVNLRLCVVSCCDEVVLMTFLLVESTELDKPLAHDIGIWRETSLDLLHGVSCDVVPILLMAVDDLQIKAIAMAYGGCHFKVFLGGAVPLLLFLRTYLYIKTVGLVSVGHKLVNDYAGVNASREQDGNLLVFHLFFEHELPRTLVCSAIFAILLVFEHGKVALVS